MLHLISENIETCALTFWKFCLKMPDVQSRIQVDSMELVKSPNDKRIYKVYRAENGLRILLISDPETDKAAACMAVNVGKFSSTANLWLLGSLCDPRQLPGLAHFCEHMLFLGTERFPTENTYSKFISEHGGQCNAATKPDETSFAFDINPANLEGALDIFSQFFISPLFTESATLREVSVSLLAMISRSFIVVSAQLF